MPYRTEHAAVIRNSDDYKGQPFFRKEISDGVSILMSRGEDGKSEAISYRFKASKFPDKGSVQEWLKRNKVSVKKIEMAQPVRESRYILYR